MDVSTALKTAITLFAEAPGARVDETRQAIDAASEARPVVEQPVKPSHMRTDFLDCPAYIEHCEEGSGSHYIPQPAAEEDISAQHGQRHKEGVDNDFDFGEGHSADTAYGDLYPLAGHCHGPAPHLGGYRHAQHGGAEQLLGYLRPQSGEGPEGGDVHVDVKHPAEEEPDHKLQ